MSTPAHTKNEVIANSQQVTFALGEKLGRRLKGGELILLTGGLGAGKTVFTKGVMSGLGYDPDEVTSPSFTLVNLYNARLDAYHIDLWRLDEAADSAVAVGLDDILANDKAVVIIEWAEKLGAREFGSETMSVTITGDGDEPRKISISGPEQFLNLDVK
ncbi:MAG TPA: tRNA (adenosine(37)-N6)-threonylcarbamoyltransferase complex ATPase subunit type 1 TsaE [Pyrinomonadaceae bacterium]|nr:tRNA (adenosine(37)-N6)-threonylcarbamoyltransferase complex ATPase subunit type 1 TsaE [Pyrinomonadaceae bacterium]